MSEAMTKEAAEAFFAVVYGGAHHIPGELKPFGHGWKINAYAGIATFDFDILTRLVLHAHDCCVRLEVVQGGPGRIGLAIWQRHTREGGIASRHPTIEQALADWRKAHPATADSASVVQYKPCEICTTQSWCETHGCQCYPVSAVQPERCCLDYPRCDCNSPPEPDDDWLCFQRPAQPKVTP